MVLDTEMGPDRIRRSLGPAFHPGQDPGNAVFLIPGLEKGGPLSVPGDLLHHIPVVHEDGKAAGDGLDDSDAEGVVVGCIQEKVHLAEKPGNVGPVPQEGNLVGETAFPAIVDTFVEPPGFGLVSPSGKIHMEGNALLIQQMQDPADERLRPSFDETADHDEVQYLVIDLDRLRQIRCGVVQLGKVNAVMDDPELVVCRQPPLSFVMQFLELADTDNPLAAAVNQLPVPFRSVREGKTVERSHHLHPRAEQSQDTDHRIRSRLRMNDVDMVGQDGLPQRLHILEHVSRPPDLDHFCTGCVERGREIIVFPIQDAEIKRRFVPFATDVINERLCTSMPETSQEKRDFHDL